MSANLQHPSFPDFIAQLAFSYRHPDFYGALKDDLSVGLEALLNGEDLLSYGITQKRHDDALVRCWITLDLGMQSVGYGFVTNFAAIDLGSAASLSEADQLLHRYCRQSVSDLKKYMSVRGVSLIDHPAAGANA